MTDRLKRFLRKLIVDGECSRVVVTHVLSGSKLGDKIAEVSIAGAKGENVDSIALEISTAIELDVNGLEHMQQYALRAYREGEKEPHSRMTIRAAPEGNPDGEITTEGPSSAGLVSQAMRHSEAMTKIMVQNSTAMFDHMARTINSLARQNETLATQRAAMVTELEEAIMMKHERDIELKREEARANAMLEAGKAVKVLAPVIASKLSGAKALTDGQSALVRALRDSLRPEQFSDLQKILAPEQTALVLELIQSAGNNGE